MCVCVQFECTGLHRASSQGHTEVVSKLMEAGANIHSRDKVQLSASAIVVFCLSEREETVTASLLRPQDMSLKIGDLPG